MSSSVTVRGADTLARTAAAAADRLEHLAATNAKAAAGILAAARPPIRTGRLAGSGSSSSSDTEATVTWSAPYAGIVEHRRGFAAAAFAARQTATLELYAAAVNAAVATVRGT